MENQKENQVHALNVANRATGKQSRRKRLSYKDEKEVESQGKQTSYYNEKKGKPEKNAERGEALIGIQEAVLTTHDGTDKLWYMDSGATAHMTSKKSWFERYNEYSTPVKFKMGDGSYLTAYGQGDILI